MADGAGEREQFPAWAKEHDVVAEIEQGGVKYKVPPSVRDRLNAPLALCRCARWAITRDSCITGNITGNIPGITAAPRS